MRFLFTTKHILTVILIIAALAVGVFVVMKHNRQVPEDLPPPEPVVEEPVVAQPVYEVIGMSVRGRKIEAYSYVPADTEETDEDEETHLVFVGGIHGGYEWNSVLLSYQFMDYLEKNPAVIPENIHVTVIPSLNPDGVYEVAHKEGRFAIADVTETTEVGQGRFNANDVDLNRNFDCKWKPTSMWRSQTVSAGTKAFSEPEAIALRDFVLKNKPDAVVFWHSQSNAVYASECEDGILPETLGIMNAYSNGSGYPAVESFTQYEITGDAEGWLASIGIPAITVELATHETVEWERNKAGVEALFEYYRKKEV